MKGPTTWYRGPGGLCGGRVGQSPHDDSFRRSQRVEGLVAAVCQKSRSYSVHAMGGWCTKSMDIRVWYLMRGRANAGSCMSHPCPQVLVPGFEPCGTVLHLTPRVRPFVSRRWCGVH